MDDIHPTFLLEAESLLKEGKARDAAVLCTKGVMKYPMYKTAYIVLIRALNELGDTMQVKEVYDDAPNFVKYSQTVQYMMNNLSPTVESVPDKVIEQEEGDLTVETEDDVLDLEESPTETKTENSIVESNAELELEINDALKNDELSPDIIENLTKSEESKEESTGIGLSNSELKETLTLAKIYEQQDAYQQALDIYIELQNSANDENLYTDKIEELTALVEAENN